MLVLFQALHSSLSKVSEEGAHEKAEDDPVSVAKSHNPKLHLS